MKVHTFCHFVWPGKQIWTRDIDLCADEELLARLSEGTGTPLPDALSTILQSFEGTVFERCFPKGRTRLISPVGVFHRKRRGYGLLYCPICLASDDEPFFRRHWRLALISSCPRHGRVLVDRCPECDVPIAPHKGDFMRCHICALDYMSIPADLGESVALQTELKLIEGAYSGLTFLAPYEAVYPVAFFDIWRQLMKVLAFGKRSSPLRDAIANRWGGDPSPPVRLHGRHDIETLSPLERHRLNGLVARVCVGWPYRLVSVCQETGNWSSHVMKDMKPARFGLLEPSRHFLSGTR